MKATKIFKYIGILFVVIGLVAGTGIIACSLGIQNKEGVFAGLFFLAMFSEQLIYFVHSVYPVI